MLKVRSSIFFLCIIFFLSFSGYSQESLWNKIDDVSNGLPGLAIQCMAEDQFDQLWIGTQQHGLAMLNSDGIVVYNKVNSGLPDNQINSIFIDQNNVKWIGTERYGLVAFDDKNWINYNTSNSDIASNTIMSVYCDTLGNVIAGTYFEGLSIFDGSSWTTFNSSNSRLLSNKITAVVKDKNGLLWVGTLGAGLYSFDGEKWVVYTDQNSNLPGNFVYDIAIDGLNNKWVGTGGSGIGVYNDDFWVVFDSYNSDLSNNHIRSILITDSGNKWISTYRSGIDNFNGQVWQHYNRDNSGLPNDEIICFEYYEPNELLIGTRQNGIISFIDTLKPTHQGYDESFAKVNSNQIVFGDISRENTKKTPPSQFIISGPVTTNNEDHSQLTVAHYKEWSAGFQFGSSIFRGDMDVTNPTSLLGVYSFSLGRRFKETRYFNTDVFTGFSVGMLKGGKKGYSFRNDFKEGTLVVKADFGKNIKPDSKWKILKPFAFIGIGVINFRSILWNIDGGIVNSYGYKVTEKNNINFDMPEKASSKYLLILPVGIGTAIIVNDNFDWCFAFSSSYHTSDILDAKVAMANDKYLFFTTGFNYRF